MPLNSEEPPEKDTGQSSEEVPGPSNAISQPPARTPEDECRERLAEIERDLSQLQGWVLEDERLGGVNKQLFADAFADMERQVQDARAAFDGGAWEKFWFVYGQFKGMVRMVLAIFWRIMTGGLF